ncbi:MAG: hypothetical protein RL660_1027 [Bacteroidota bacterium]|jgi:hypothetical protein
MKRILILALVCFSAFSAFAQQGIYGKISSEKNAALPMQELRLLNADSIAVQAVLSNENGEWGFDVATIGTYHLQIKSNDSQSVYIYNISVDSAASQTLDLVVQTSPSAPKRFIGKQSLLTSTQIDKMPTTNALDMLTRSSNFVNAKHNAPIRSMTAPGKEAVTYIVDGMVVPAGDNLIFTPGSLQSIDIIKH